MAPHSSTLAWKIPGTEECSRLKSMGSLRVGHDWAMHFHFSLSCIGEGNGNPLHWRIPGTGEPGGLPSMGSHRVGHNWSDLAAAAAGLYTVWNACSYSVTPRTVARQAPPSMGFSGQEYWSGLPFPTPGDLPNPGIRLSPRISGIDR